MAKKRREEQPAQGKRKRGAKAKKLAQPAVVEGSRAAKAKASAQPAQGNGKRAARAKRSAGERKGAGGGGEQRSAGGEGLCTLLHAALPGDERLETVEDCLDRIRLLVRQLCGEDAGVVVQGSYAQGLALRGSDLDVAVIMDTRAAQQGGQGGQGRKARRGGTAGGAAGDAVDKRRAAALLRRLAVAIGELKSPELRVAARILAAQVPILRLHGSTGESGAKGAAAARVVVDVSIGASLARGACDRCVHSLLRRDRSGMAPALCRLVKLWAKRRQLTDTLRGGFSSFSFVLLVLFFLQNLEVGQALPRSLRLPPHSALASAASLGCIEGSCPEQHRGFADGGGAVEERGLAAALKAFFEWASQTLPGLGQQALSVVTGRAEPRHGAHLGSRCPVVLEVPFLPDANAARCLRAAVWEASVLPELVRARQLSAQVVGSSGRARSGFVRQLFATQGVGRGEDEEDPPPAAQRGEFKRSWLDVLEAEAAAEAAPVPVKDALRAARRKRRRAGEEWAPTAAAEDGGARTPPAVPSATVHRFIGLRAMLNPESE